VNEKDCKKNINVTGRCTFGVSMVACTSDEIALIEAMSKTSEISSYEGNSKIQLSFKGQGFSEKTQKVFDFLASYVDGFTFEANQKYSSNDEKTKATLAMDGNVDMQVYDKKRSTGAFKSGL